MGATTTVTVEGYAHCPDSLCPGSDQVQIPVVHEHVEQTIGDNGGDGVLVSVVERTFDYLRAADAGDAECECGRLRELSLQPRPSYQRLIGPPDALLRARRAGIHGPTTPEGVATAAGVAASTEPTARERLDMRYVNGEIEDKQYFAMRAALDGGTGAPTGK